SRRVRSGVSLLTQRLLVRAATDFGEFGRFRQKVLPHTGVGSNGSSLGCSCSVAFFESGVLFAASGPIQVEEHSAFAVGLCLHHGGGFVGQVSQLSGGAATVFSDDLAEHGEGPRSQGGFDIFDQAKSYLPARAVGVLCPFDDLGGDQGVLDTVLSGVERAVVLPPPGRAAERDAALLHCGKVCQVEKFSDLGPVEDTPLVPRNSEQREHGA